MNNKFLYVILVAILGVLGFEGYFMYNNYQNNKVNDNETTINNDTNKDNSSNEQLEDKVKLVDTKKENNKIIQEYEIVLNGKKNNLTLTYSFNSYENGFGGEDIESYCINSDYYSNCNLDNNQEKYMDKDYINNSFNENNFDIIKGLDNKNYLTIHKIDFAPIGNSYFLYVLNDNLENIKSQNPEDAYFLGFEYYTSLCVDENCENLGDFWYKDNFGLCSEGVCQIRTKVEDNKIYYLSYTGACEEGKIEERVYTIKDNKLSYEILNTYQMREMC